MGVDVGVDVGVGTGAYHGVCGFRIFSMNKPAFFQSPLSGTRLPRIIT